ncbi:MAG: helix-turn-helix domain-containing protein [Faecousia sp.]
MDIAKEIKSIRLRTGLTQTEFGQRLGGIPLRTIQNWENGVTSCPPYVLELIRFRVDHDDSIPKRQ